MYLKGSGTKTDPYVIHNEAAFKYFLETDGHWGTSNSSTSIAMKYFSVVSNIDLGGYTPAFNPAFKPICSLNLNGHKVSGFFIRKGVYSDALTPYMSILNNLPYPETPRIETGVFKFTTDAEYSIARMQNQGMGLTLTDLVFDAGKNLLTSRGDLSSFYFTRVLFKTLVGDIANGGTYFKCIDCYSNGVQLNCKDISSAPFWPESYPALKVKNDIWLLQGTDWPTTIENKRTDLTVEFAIKGTTRVGNSRKQRDISIISSAYMLPIKRVKSSDTGDYIASLADYGDAVIVIHYDDYGYPLKIDTTYKTGEVVHPLSANGYRYICETSGTTGPALPPEPWSVETLLVAGTAKFRPKPIYEPKAIGPMFPKKINLVTGEPI